MRSFTIKTALLLLNTLLTGLLAGSFFIWTNAITPGIGKLSDVNYLQVFQHMNRTILNPLFYIVIIGPIFLSFVAIYFYLSQRSILYLLIAAAAIYFFGVFIVTVFGNIPLNELLDKTELAHISIADAKSLRDTFEIKWNNLHLVRTIASITSFLLLILSCLFRN